MSSSIKGTTVTLETAEALPTGSPFTAKEGVDQPVAFLADNRYSYLLPFTRFVSVKEFEAMVSDKIAQFEPFPERSSLYAVIFDPLDIGVSHDKVTVLFPPTEVSTGISEVVEIFVDTKFDSLPSPTALRAET